MKATTVAGMASGVVLTASVVVAFVQQASFVVPQTSRHSMALFAGSDDLSALLQSAKTDFGVSSSSSASSSAKAAVSSIAEAAKSVTPPTPPPLPTEAVKAAEEVVSESVSKVVNAAASVTSVSPVEEGKARPLFNFVQATVTGDANPVNSNTNWEATKANSALLMNNIVKMTGKDPATVSLPKASVNLPKVGGGVAFDMGAMPNFDVKAIQQYVEALPDDAKTLAALATGTVLLLLGANNNKEKADKEPTDVRATSEAVSGLKDELGTLKDRMKALEANGLDLDSQLKAATSKLTQKELDISRARLQAADASLNLNREIDTLRKKLNANDGRVKTLDDELAKAREECLDLVKQLEEAKKEQDSAAKAAALEAEAAAKKKEAEAAAKKKEEAAAKKKKEAAAKKEKEAAAKKEKEAAAKKEETLPEASDAAPKKAAPKKASAKKATAPKKKSVPKARTKTKAPPKKAAETKAKTEAPAKKAAPKKKYVEVKKELPKAEDTPAPPAAAEKPAPKKKAAAKRKAAAPAADKNDLTTLTKSALSRTTIKVFNEFLEAKGIPTVDKDGKQLKKADLIDAVQSISS